MTSPTFRAFIAIELPAPVHASLGALSEELHRRDRGGAVRWARQEGIHLTLQFLGETPESQVEEIREVLARVAVRHHPFMLRLGSLGAFPNDRGARVLWVGLEGEVGTLVALQRDLAASLQALGYRPEGREFTPHLTLGRVPGGRLDAGTLFQGASWPLAERVRFPAEGISLIQSTLLPQGARYTRRLFLPFAPGGSV